MQTSDTSFYHLGIAPKMLKLLEKNKFVQPTPIQHKAIPIAIEGKDIFGVAQTGTGKTLAFGIPTIQRLASMGKAGALILLPTRELAIQVEEALKPLLREFNMTSVVLIGGIPLHRQYGKLAKKPRFIIATPGRLNDHIRQRRVKLSNIEVLILDEADRMFDMGFAPQIEEIIKHIKKQRQTLLFSATMPEEIVKLATKHMKLPIRIEIAPQGTTAKKITQELFIVKENRKRTLLKAVLKDYRGPILVFVRMKVGAKKIKAMIAEMGYKVAEIHSNRTMGQRKLAIEGFKEGKFQILVATDIAARGIDVSNIELVLNFDLPEDVESYVHRIGRTGRAGTEGHAISFAKPDQGFFVSKIEKMIRKTIPISRHDESEKEWDEKNAKRPRNRGRGRKSSGGKSRPSSRSFGKRSGEDKKSSRKSFGDKKGGDRSFKKKSYAVRKDDDFPGYEKETRGRSFDQKSPGDKKFGKKGLRAKKSGGRKFGKESFGDRKGREESPKKRTFGVKKDSKKRFKEKGFRDDQKKDFGGKKKRFREDKATSKKNKGKKTKGSSELKSAFFREKAKKKSPKKFGKRIR